MSIRYIHKNMSIDEFITAKTKYLNSYELGPLKICKILNGYVLVQVN